MAVLCYLVLIAALGCAVRRPVVLVAALGCGIRRTMVSRTHLAPATTINFVACSQKSKFIGAATTFSIVGSQSNSNAGWILWDQSQRRTCRTSRLQRGEIVRRPVVLQRLMRADSTDCTHRRIRNRTSRFSK